MARSCDVRLVPGNVLRRGSMDLAVPSAADFIHPLRRTSRSMALTRTPLPATAVVPPNRSESRPHQRDRWNGLCVALSSIPLSRRGLVESRAPSADRVRLVAGCQVSSFCVCHPAVIRPRVVAVCEVLLLRGAACAFAAGCGVQGECGGSEAGRRRA